MSKKIAHSTQIILYALLVFLFAYHFYHRQQLDFIVSMLRYMNWVSPWSTCPTHILAMYRSLGCPLGAGSSKFWVMDVERLPLSFSKKLFYTLIRILKSNVEMGFVEIRTRKKLPSGRHGTANFVRMHSEKHSLLRLHVGCWYVGSSMCVICPWVFNSTLWAEL